jgi:hypothetical protein
MANASRVESPPFGSPPLGKLRGSESERSRTVLLESSLLEVQGICRAEEVHRRRKLALGCCSFQPPHKLHLPGSQREQCQQIGTRRG